MLSNRNKPLVLCSKIGLVKDEQFSVVSGISLWGSRTNVFSLVPTFLLTVSRHTEKRSVMKRSSCNKYFLGFWLWF